MSKIEYAGSEQRGQVLVITALLMLVALGFMALVFDAGFAYAARREQQNAADNASMAATRLIAAGSTDDTAIKAEVDHYIAQNNGTLHSAEYIDSGRNPIGGCQVGSCGSVPAGAVGVQVASRTVRVGFFSQLLGQSNYLVSAPAAAIAQPAALPSSVGDLMPLAIPVAAWESPGTPDTVVFWGAQYHSGYTPFGLTLPADFKGIVDLPPTDTCPQNSGPQRVACQIDNGYDGPIAASIPYQSGEYGNNVRGALEARCDANGGTATIFVLVYGNNPVPHHGNLDIVGVAAIEIAKANIGANEAAGRFVSYTMAYAPPGADTGNPYQAKTIRLVPREPGPTATPGPTPTGSPGPTPTPTPTASPIPPTMHVGDLSGTGYWDGNKWRAQVTVVVHDGNCGAVAEATVSGSFTEGGGTGSCVTDGSGSCQITSDKINKGKPQTVFTVTGVSHDTNVYEPGRNHEVSETIAKP